MRTHFKRRDKDTRKPNKLTASLSQKSHLFTQVFQGLILICSLGSMLSLTGCRQEVNRKEDKPSENHTHHQNANQSHTLYVSTWLIAYLTQSLLVGRDVQNTHLDIKMISPPGQDPAGYVPDIHMLTQLQKARLIILNGADFERGLDTVSLPLNRVVKTASSQRSQWLKYPKSFSQDLHQHGPEGAHSHRGFDGHTWLDPHLLRYQLEAIKTRLIDAGYRISLEGQTRLHNEIDQLDNLWNQLSTILKRHKLLSNHPAYQYIAKRYHLKITSFDLSPNDRPQQTQVNRIRQHLHEQLTQINHGPLVMLWESTPNRSVLEELKSLQLTHITINTLEHPPAISALDKSTYMNPLKLYYHQLRNLAKAQK